MIVTMHQPEHLIWLGLIDKISRSDVFVIVDTVQYRRHYFQNRNKIRTRDGWIWLTVPIKKHPLKTKIVDIEISYNQNWVDRYLAILKLNYKNAKYFDKYYPKLEKVFLQKDKYLVDVNIKLINFVLESFQVKKKIIRSFELELPEIKGGGSNVALEICKKLSANTYLSGSSGPDYLKISNFESNKIPVIFHKFRHPIYKQLYGKFIPEMSAIDLLFNYGQQSKDILWSQPSQYV